MAVAFRVGLRQRPPEKKGKEGRVRGQPVPSLVPMHELTAAIPRHSSPSALGLGAETDSLLEEMGFELLVPLQVEAEAVRRIGLEHRPSALDSAFGR